MHFLLHSAVPGLLAFLVVLGIAWRSQASAFVVVLLLLVAANSNVHAVQTVALAGRWGGLAAVAASVVWTLPLRWHARPQRGLWVVLAVFLGYALISTAWSASPHWTLMRTASFGVLLWTVFAGIRPALLDEREARRLARGVVVLLALVVAVSLLLWAGDPGLAAPGGQFRGIFLNPAYLPLFIGLTYPLVLAQFDSLPSRRYLVASLVTGGAGFVVLSLCQSRAGLVAFIIAALTYEAARGRVVRVVAPAVALLAAFVVFELWQPPLLTSGHSRFLSPATLVAGPRAPGQSVASALVSGRDEVWSATGRLVAKRPLVGYGFGTGDRLLRAQRFKYFAGFSPHNAYLQVLLELGALGMVVLLIPLAFGLSSVVRVVRARTAPPEIAAFAAVFLCGLVDGIFEDVFEAAGSPFAPLIWLSCAVVLVRVRRRSPAAATEWVGVPAGSAAARAYHPSP